MLSVSRFVGEYKGCCQCRHADAEVEQGVAVRDEGIWVESAGSQYEWASGVRRIGPVVPGLGVEVVWGAGASGADVAGDGIGRFREVGIGLREDAVVVDGGDVRAGAGFGLRQKKSRSKENCGGLQAKDATGICHDGRDFAGRVSRRMKRCVAADQTIGL